jgi:hypothetical protein
MFRRIMFDPNTVIQKTPGALALNKNMFGLKIWGKVLGW